MSNLRTAVEHVPGIVHNQKSILRSYRFWLNITVLACSDVLAFAIAVVLFRRGPNIPQVVFLPDATPSQLPLDVFYILGCVFVAVRYLFGDYSRRRLFWDSARSTTLTAVILGIPCLLITALLPHQYSVLKEITSWLFVMFSVPIFRQGARIIMDRLGIWRLPTALITSASRFADIFATINNTLSLGHRVQWIVFENNVMPNTLPSHNMMLLGMDDLQTLSSELAARGCDQAVIAMDDMQSAQFSNLVQRLMELDIGVSFIPTFSRLPLAGVTTSYFFGKDLPLFQVRTSLQSLPSRFAKRSFDIVFSMLALFFLCPVFMALAFVIKRCDGGPVIYRQKRTGRNGEPFNCLKFRTMAVDADERLHRWKIENPELYAEFQKTCKLVNDPRITNPGIWLRKTSLDELPQLINVLRGEMSLVGPRPVLERELIEFYGPAARLYKRVRPGITGLWQVRGRSDTSYEERVVFDEWYILNWSFWSDIVILLQTVIVVVLRRGAY